MPTKFRFQSSEILIVIKIFKQEWCPEVESNHRHKDFQSFALPTELSGQIRKKNYN